MKTMNRGMVTAFSAIGIAQGLKILTHKRLTGKWDWKQAFTTGGMPSSHSAGVTALATYVAANKGTRHTETALAAVFGVIVMYDAQGIRRHTGEIAQLVIIYKTALLRCREISQVLIMYKVIKN